ncbi:hypothetical protein AX16_001536 [Volvariella volvacea WC 439]|nr:hypothetical protein AX16_001536 [Volvariella volvacea WC 439]
MAPCGSKIYHYNGLFYIRESFYSSYEVCLPRVLGVERQWLDGVYKFGTEDVDEEDEDGEDASYYWCGSSKSMLVNWSYTIDLDEEVFLINDHPMFSLANPPPRGVFLASIGEDSYGHMACAPNTLEKYRYNWTAPPFDVE